MDNQQPSVNNPLCYRKPKAGYGFIYKYTSPSGKNYIGQTITTLARRASNIISGNGYKKCPLFWKAIEKYGWTNFQVDILAEAPIPQLDSLEIYYIEQFQSLAPNGYNIALGGSSGESKNVYVYSAQTGELLEKCNSVSEASLLTGVNITIISTIINSSNKHRKQSHNFIFSFEYFPSYDLHLIQRSTAHQIYVYDLKGRYLTNFFSIREAERSLGITNIHKCLNGRATHIGNYQFSDVYTDTLPEWTGNKKTPISVIQIDPATQEEIAVYNSLSSAAKAVGLSSGAGIKKVLDRGKGLSGGYFWKINKGSTTKEI